MTNEELYLKAIVACEKNDYHTFTNATDKIKSNNDLLFMILLESSLPGGSFGCFEYVLNLVNLNMEQLNLCILTMYMTGTLPLLLKRKRNIEYNRDMYLSLRDKFETKDANKFKELMESVNSSSFNFRGSAEDFILIKNWLDTIKFLNN